MLQHNQFQVRARNSKNESPPSTLVKHTFDDISNIDRLTGLQTINIGTDFINLRWNPIKNVLGYLVQPVLPQPYPKLQSFKTTKTEYKLTDLVPGAHFTVRVSAFIKNYYGRVSSIYVVLPGPALPEVSHPSMFHNGTLTRLRWSKPSTNLQNLTYGIYYGTTLDELYDSKLCLLCLSQYLTFIILNFRGSFNNPGYKHSFD